MRWLGFTWVALLVMASPNSHAKGCFETHLLESIALNQARKPTYSLLTGGKSEKISDLLIAGERLTQLTSAKYFDWRAAPFEAKGIKILCDGFVSMHHVPPLLSNPSLKKKPPGKFVGVNTLSLMATLLAAVKAESYARGTLVKIVTLKLKSIPHRDFNCMLRHVLESIIRFSVLGEAQEKLAKEKKMKSPSGIRMGVIHSHILSIPYAHSIDMLAKPLQSRGIPIVCADLPEVLP